ncbi:hypothetical protein [Brachyspira aalborgi]|nr:hypothetical protein [Brachyspira aalborgi]
MPCFYSKNMDRNPDYFLCLFKHIRYEYEIFCKGDILDNNTTVFGFLLIFYYCLLKSTNLQLNDDIKSYFEKEFSPINNDIKGFDLNELKIEIENLIYNNKNTNIINTKRQILDADIFDNVNTKKGMDWFYRDFLNYCEEQKLNYDNKIRPHIFELKKVYFAASKNFKNSCKFSYLSKIIDMKKDFKYLYIDKLNLNNYTSHECSCEGYDCKYMIDLFNNEEVDIIAEVGKDIENI